MDQQGKNQSTDRQLVIGKIAGKNTLQDDGSIANRLFAGGNKLHAVMGPDGLWTLHLDAGILPSALQQQFTNFTILKRTAAQYFHKRNLEIKEVIS